MFGKQHTPPPNDTPPGVGFGRPNSIPRVNIIGGGLHTTSIENSQCEECSHQCGIAAFGGPFLFHNWQICPRRLETTEYCDFALMAAGSFVPELSIDIRHPLGVRCPSRQITPLDSAGILVSSVAKPWVINPTVMDKLDIKWKLPSPPLFEPSIIGTRNLILCQRCRKNFLAWPATPPHNWPP